MTKRFLLMAALLAAICAVAPAQPPESFFPSQVGNLWQYDRNAFTNLEDWSILRDSIDNSGFRYLYARILRTGEQYWRYRLDSVNVYGGGNPWPLQYRLDADSGDVWTFGAYYAWIAEIDSVSIFGRLTTRKIIRVGPEYPDSNWWNWYYCEQHLASGFGIIYHWEEPGYVAFLRGCIVDGDTFGVVVPVPDPREELPASTLLLQNYPNPFNPTTTIEYQIAQSGFVRLRVFDILGKEVRTLAEAFQEPGQYKLRFDGSDLSSGVYLCKFETHNGVQMNRMLLMK